MRCKKHFGDLSSDIGVCASCLRERLLSVMVAQAEKEAALRQEYRRKEIQHQDYPSFPCSVSPYLSRTHLSRQRFFSTPQVRVAEEIREEEERRKSKGGMLSSLLFKIFRSKSDNQDRIPGRVTDPTESSTASLSWLSTIVSGRLKKQNTTFSLDDSIQSKRKPYRYRDRGMSPIRNPNEEENGVSTGYSSESPHSLRQTPRRTPAFNRRVGGKVPAVGGISFCLSPLVRPSPSRQWNQKGQPIHDISTGVESRTPAKGRLSSAASFCKSRSRKLADFGRNIYFAND